MIYLVVSADIAIERDTNHELRDELVEAVRGAIVATLTAHNARININVRSKDVWA